MSIFTTGVVAVGAPYRGLATRAAQLEGRRAAQLSRVRGFTPIPGKANRSTRGLRGKSWLTKAHTPSRLRDMTEASNG